MMAKLITILLTPMKKLLIKGSAFSSVLRINDISIDFTYKSFKSTIFSLSDLSIRKLLSNLYLLFALQYHIVIIYTWI